MQERKKEKLAQKDQITNIDDMPDCLRKFEMITMKCGFEKSYKFTDVEFSHSNESQVLGAAIMNRQESPGPKHGTTQWKRASEIDGCELFVDGADCRDVVQGAIGDCYLLSAFSVLGNDRIKEIFCSDIAEANTNWKTTGCFVVRFPGGGRGDDESIVIVDDYIPLNAQGKPNFASGGSDGLELWPAILEKAYAKLYGSYSAIVGGKVHVALADLITDGFPEQINLRKFKNNLAQFTTSLEEILRTTDLLGAGSPDNQLGDTAITPSGIV